MSRTFSMNRGSGESLNDSVRCGCNPNACQIRPIVSVDNPTSRAIERRLQCVSPRGVVSSVLVTISSTRASVTLRGAPGRGSSSRPSNRRRRKRLRYFSAVARPTPKVFAIAVLPSPSAAASTMRARRATAFAVFCRRASSTSLARSSSVSSMGLGFGPRTSSGLMQHQTSGRLLKFHSLRTSRSGD